jgi:hypothetical protein
MLEVVAAVWWTGVLGLGVVVWARVGTARAARKSEEASFMVFLW